MNAILVCLLVSLSSATPPGYSPDQLVQVGKSYAERGDSIKAIEVLKEALKGKPKAEGEAEYLLGLSYSRLDRLPEAKAHLERATTLEPKRYDAWMLLGMTRDLSKDLEGAIAAYRKAVALAPARPEAHKELAGTLLMLGRPQEAIPELEAALKAGPSAELLGELGYAQLMAQRCADAAATLAKARAADPKNPDAAVHLGDAQACQGKTDEAIGSYEAALALRPDHVRGLFHLGLMRMKKGEVNAARDALERARKLDPYNEKIGAALERLDAK